MKTEWQKELCSIYPATFEQLNPDVYIQRRNIVRRETVTDDSMMSGDPGFECESRYISKDVYEAFMEQLESPSQQQIINNLVTVQDNQSLSDGNTMIVMSALADIYEVIDSIMAQLPPTSGGE